MAKRKKAGAKPAAARRTTRRAKQAPAATEGEPSTAAEPSTSDSAVPELPTETSASSTDKEPEPQKAEVPVTKPCQVPIMALHKKFGKYRCFFNSDDSFTRKYEMGSDSETNSSVEIKVIDPCASSESDSNAALDTHSDTNSGACYSPKNSITGTSQSTSRDTSPVTVQIDTPSIIEQEGDTSPVIEIPFLCDNEPEIPPIMQDLPKHDIVEQHKAPHFLESNEDPIDLEELDKIVQPEEIHDELVQDTNHDIPLDEEQLLYAGDDEEIITVVQIVEDDHHELYYDIKIDSPKDLAHQSITEDAKTSVVQNVPKTIYLGSSESDIQKHFESLNLTAKPQSYTPMDCSEIIDITTPPCVTPDLQFSKDESLVRPDPSLTPSSTLSDDSNSSRIVEQGLVNSNDSAESSPTGVRRSSRIKTISNMKQKTKGYGLVKTPLKKALITQTKLKLEEMGSDSQEKSLDLMPINAPNSPSFPIPSEMPVKVKSRWRRSSELEMGTNSPASSPLASPNLPKMPAVAENNDTKEEQTVTPLTKEAYDKIIEDRMNQYQHLEENEYLCERMISKDTKKMICDCFMTKEELERGELACGEDCLNRLLMIECNSRCPVGDRCTNRRFQKRENALLKVFYADKKGCGVEAAVDISAGEFLMEYVGEVLDYEQFYKRAQAYSDENNLHHYFMSLKGDTVIDATLKGNISRFINHSCEPNAETQKWTVNGELRIGFFSKRDIVAGEELTFDYQFQRFGKVAQRCYCGAENCRGWIGAEPDSDDEDYEEEEEDVSTSKSGTTESSEESAATAAETPQARPRRAKKERKYKPKAPDLVQDADIEEELEALGRTGVKNQWHTLRLSRTVVRAKSRRAQAALLRLLRDADLPCRRLFLDYRGLRLLAPWCSDAPLHFRWEMLQTVDRLPIPNKTMVQESRFFTIVERWLSAADAPPTDPVFIDESTGLPVELPNRDAVSSPEKIKETVAIMEKVKELSNQLLERWASLKEVFKIPKKERIQQMKEHERQANVERRAADSSGSRDRDRDRRDDRDRDKDRERERDRERDRDRERERERDRDRERERERERDRDRYRERERERERDRDRDRDDRDRRKRRSPDGRRSIRLSERVLAAVPPMSKEERRRAFAEAAAAAEETRRQRDRQPWPPHYWPPEQFSQMFPPGMMGGPNNMPMMMAGMPQTSMTGGMPGGIPPGLPPGNMMPNSGMVAGGPMMAGMMGGMPPADVPPEWLAEFQGGPPWNPGPFQQPQPFCMPQPNLLGMSGFGMGGFMFGQQLPFPHHAHPPDPRAAPLPPPTRDPETKEVILPSLWRSAKDPRGRTYYYHVKLRRPQWVPPPLPASPDESSSEEEDEQVSALDSPVVRRQLMGKVVEGVNGIYKVMKEEQHNGLIPEHALLTMKPRKRRPGLVSERPISPRTEEDKLAGRMEVKRYKQTKEKLRRRKEKLLQKVRLLSTKSKIKAVEQETKLVELIDSDSDEDEDEEEEVNEKVASPVVEEELSPPVEIIAPVPPVAPVAPIPPSAPAPAVDPAEAARKIKEQFRSSMARVMVQHLNPYRHSDAPAGRITCTADFKHLARKLTHFVMLKELKHCRTVEELVVTDSVRSKAKMFVKKYMAKFGPVYKRPPEEAD